MNPTPPSGFKSSEFAAIAIAIMTALAGTGTGTISDTTTMIVGALAAVFALCRTGLKAVHALGYARSVADLPELPAELQGAADNGVAALRAKLAAAEKAHETAVTSEAAKLAGMRATLAVLEGSAPVAEPATPLAGNA